MNLDWSAQSRRLQELLARSECVVSREQVDLALDRMALDIETEYAGRVPVLLGVMVGGIMPLAALAQRLRIPLQMDYLHATRYCGGTRGGELHWLVRPRLPLEGRDVIVIDDILDEGITLASVLREIKGQGVSSLRVAVLARKLHGRSLAPVTVDYLGVDVPDRYVFGCGMDYQEFFRQLPAIYALPEEE
jgi:hypoxanthine phosphoribosyltransferase